MPISSNVRVLCCRIWKERGQGARGSTFSHLKIFSSLCAMVCGRLFETCMVNYFLSVLIRFKYCKSKRQHLQATAPLSEAGVQ